MVAITARAMADLDAVRGRGGDYTPVFGLSPAQINRRLREAAKAAGLGAGFSGHSGRVGMARRMTGNGAPNGSDHESGTLEKPPHGGQVHAGRGSRRCLGISVTRSQLTAETSCTTPNERRNVLG